MKINCTLKPDDNQMYPLQTDFVFVLNSFFKVLSIWSYYFGDLVVFFLGLLQDLLKAALSALQRTRLISSTKQSTFS
jgi:hypothetical protein